MTQKAMILMPRGFVGSVVWDPDLMRGAAPAHSVGPGWSCGDLAVPWRLLSKLHFLSLQTLF